MHFEPAALPHGERGGDRERGGRTKGKVLSPKIDYWEDKQSLAGVKTSQIQWLDPKECNDEDAVDDIDTREVFGYVEKSDDRMQAQRDNWNKVEELNDSLCNCSECCRIEGRSQETNGDDDLAQEGENESEESLCQCPTCVNEHEQETENYEMLDDDNENPEVSSMDSDEMHNVPMRIKDKRNTAPYRDEHIKAGTFPIREMEELNSPYVDEIATIPVLDDTQCDCDSCSGSTHRETNSDQDENICDDFYKNNTENEMPLLKTGVDFKEQASKMKKKKARSEFEESHGIREHLLERAYDKDEDLRSPLKPNMPSRSSRLGRPRSQPSLRSAFNPEFRSDRFVRSPRMEGLRNSLNSFTDSSRNCRVYSDCCVYTKAKTALTP